ncbi:hypothetical protein P154DRAFT_571002 [Amniculicola lignicola CBS 123094]|uniref:Uncharacterized protein n=1 Tax=Amniculicola lignicola CBS 123094 TaxID=1392246 RepID=A0A6A5X1L7_9PLEO|nr:hypothetical protein P154DRAFT_571002 [Amniculicola lignicola CBS 123094]
MPSQPLRNTLAFTKGLLAGQIVDNRLNSQLLALATTGYRVHSTLHIPDPFGLFSPSTPHLQVHQATLFILFALASWLTISLCGLLLYVLRPALRPDIWFIAAQQFVGPTTLIASLYVFICCGRHRQPGYEWEDWKVHEG